MSFNFKYVKEIKFKLCDKTFKNVYYDRCNSVFKGFYVVASLEDVKKFQAFKVNSTERFGQQDVEFAIKVPDGELMEEQKRIIGKLNVGLLHRERLIQLMPQGKFNWKDW